MNQENSQQAAQEQAAQEQERAHIQVILASGSPRRREILEREGIPFQVRGWSLTGHTLPIRHVCRPG